MFMYFSLKYKFLLWSWLLHPQWALWLSSCRWLSLHIVSQSKGMVTLRATVMKAADKVNTASARFIVCIMYNKNMENWSEGACCSLPHVFMIKEFTQQQQNKILNKIYFSTRVCMQCHLKAPGKRSLTMVHTKHTWSLSCVRLPVKFNSARFKYFRE